MNKWIWAIIVIVVLAGAWYWWSTQGASSAPANSSATTTAQPGAASPAQAGSSSGENSVSQNLALGLNSDARLGQYLIASNGMTVYTYAKDSAGKSNCTGTCAVNWPPYTVPAGTTLNLQAGVTGAISTITRAGGSTQVTYNGRPLYFYAKDTKPGDTTGQGIGGVWYVVKP